jgi:hypothetical protein
LTRARAILFFISNFDCFTCDPGRR